MDTDLQQQLFTCIEKVDTALLPELLQQASWRELLEKAESDRKANECVLGDALHLCRAECVKLLLQHCMAHNFALPATAREN
jgi:hypothetical protein